MASNPALNETIYIDFVISDATGAAANADSSPAISAAIFEDAGGPGPMAYIPAVTSRGLVGQYYITIACTGTNSFEVGKCYSVIVSASVGGIAAKAKVGEFKLRLCTVDRIGIGGVEAVAVTGGVTLTSGERAAIATAVMATAGNDTVANSPGKRINDTVVALNQFAGLQLVGKVAPSTPAPSATAFDVVLNPAMGTAETQADLVNLWVTFRSGNRQAVTRQITTAIVHSPTSISLTFGAGFPLAPLVDDLVSISA